MRWQWPFSKLGGSRRMISPFRTLEETGPKTTRKSRGHHAQRRPIPRVTSDMSLADALVETSRKGFGMTTSRWRGYRRLYRRGSPTLLDAGKIFTLPESQTSCRQNLSTFLPAPSSRSREYHAEVSGLCSYCHRFRSQTIRHSENA